jgi:copper(I)-binding protein
MLEPISWRAWRVLTLLTFAVSLAAPALSAQPAPASAGITVRDAWSRATAPGAEVAVVYLSLENPGAADRLLSVSTPCAERAELHTMAMEGGVMRMRRVAAGLALAAGATLRLQPRGPHIMLIRPTQPLLTGGNVELTLHFERAPSLTVRLPVLPIGSDGPPRRDAP